MPIATRRLLMTRIGEEVLSDFPAPSWLSAWYYGRLQIIDGLEPEFVEDRRLGVDVFESSMPLKRASALFELAPTSGGCELTLTFDYEVKYGLIGKAMDAIVMRRMMTKNFGALLRALDEHLTTGEDIPRGWQPVRAA